MAAHSSPLVRFLLMDDKGGEERRIKAYLVCVCAERVDESRCDVCVEIILYQLDLIMYGWISCTDMLVLSRALGRRKDMWMCMDMFVYSCLIL